MTGRLVQSAAMEAMSETVPLELWRGLVEVRRLPDSELLRGSAGAFTTIVTWASNSAEFRNKAERLAASLGLYVLGVEGEHPVADDPPLASDEVADLLERAGANPSAILYGTFHTYRHDDA
jgi:hypothetical protein